MYRLIAILQVRNFDAFDKFETEAARIMSLFHGRIVQAFEIQRQHDGSGEEIHFLEFPSEADFTSYRNDSRLAALSGLREQAISATEIKVCQQQKTYL